jgi:hypothetical protein
MDSKWLKGVAPGVDRPAQRALSSHAFRNWRDHIATLASPPRAERLLIAADIVTHTFSSCNTALI